MQGVLTTGHGRKIAYHRTPGQGPGVIFLGGFRSDMTGTKAVHLQTWAEKTGRAFLRFDYSGHGASSGEFLDGCIGDWAEDARDAFESLTVGPQVLVGSSMGGLVAQGLATKRLDLVRGLVLSNTAAKIGHESQWQARSAAIETGGMAAVVDAVMGYLGTPTASVKARPRATARKPGRAGAA